MVVQLEVSGRRLVDAIANPAAWSGECLGFKQDPGYDGGEKSRQSVRNIAMGYIGIKSARGLCKSGLREAVDRACLLWLAGVLDKAARPLGTVGGMSQLAAIERRQPTFRQRRGINCTEQ